MLQNKEISNESAREIEGAPRRTQPEASGIAPAPREQDCPTRTDRCCYSFFFFVILTDKTDAGRRDRERLFITMLYLPISQNASVRERNLTNFHFWYKLSPPELGRSSSKAKRCVEIRIFAFCARCAPLHKNLFPATRRRRSKC